MKRLKTLSLHVTIPGWVPLHWAMIVQAWRCDNDNLPANAVRFERRI